MTFGNIYSPYGKMAIKTARNDAVQAKKLSF